MKFNPGLKNYEVDEEKIEEEEVVDVESRRVD